MTGGIDHGVVLRLSLDNTEGIDMMFAEVAVEVQLVGNAPVHVVGHLTARVALTHNLAVDHRHAIPVLHRRVGLLLVVLEVYVELTRVAQAVNQLHVDAELTIGDECFLIVNILFALGNIIEDIAIGRESGVALFIGLHLFIVETQAAVLVVGCHNGQTAIDGTAQVEHIVIGIGRRQREAQVNTFAHLERDIGVQRSTLRTRAFCDGVLLIETARQVVR